MLIHHTSGGEMRARWSPDPDDPFGKRLVCRWQRKRNSEQERRKELPQRHPASRRSHDGAPAEVTARSITHA